MRKVCSAVEEKKKQHLMRRQLPSAPETVFLLIHLSFDPSVSYIIHSLPKLSSYVKLHAFPCSSSKFSFSNFIPIPLFWSYAQMARVTMNRDYSGERSTCVEQQGRGSGGRCLNVCLWLIGPQMSQRPSQITVCPEWRGRRA